jgi:CHAT domain-containing protein/tetratricopeptide (TPR) repeat protein
MPMEWAMTMNNLGTAYDDRIRGDCAENQDEALRCYRAALAIGSNLASPRQWAIRRNNLGSVFLHRIRGDRAENIEEAINCYQAALTVRTREAMPIEWAMTQSDIGYAYVKRIRGNRAENLEQAISHLTASLSVRTREMMPAEWAKTRNNLGNAYRDRTEGNGSTNLATAEECYREAAETFEKLGVRREAVRSYRNLGRLEIERKNWATACQCLEKAAELLEGELAESHTEVGRLSWLREESGVYDGLIAAYLLAHQAAGASREPGPTNVSRACYWSERSRARYLADLMAASERVPEGVAEETYGLYRATMHRVRDLDQRVDVLERKRAGLGQEPSERGEVEQEIAARRTQRNEAYAQVVSLRDQFAKADLDWAAGAKSLSVESMLEVARNANAALLTLRPTPWGTSVILVLPSGKVAGGVLKSLLISRIQELLARFHDDKPVGGWMVEYGRYRSASKAEEEECRRCWHQELDRTLGRLGEWLWQPLKKWLEKVYARSENADYPKPLIILPGQGLNILPLHACWWQEGGKRCWACDEYRISYVPSIWVLDRCLARQATFRSLPRHLLAVRNPTSDLEWANWEVDGVCRLFPSTTVLGGASDSQPATRKRLKKELPRFPLALLCTHGTYEITDPWNKTGLCTADAEKNDPSQPCLTLADIFEMKLSRLWLAVLSACESGVADYRDPAGEQMGLPSALLGAGAITAVGSLWVVDDLATALLSRRFFQELFVPGTDNGMTKGLALWRAQRWLRTLTRQELLGLRDSLPQSLQEILDRYLSTSRDMVRPPPSPLGSQLAKDDYLRASRDMVKVFREKTRPLSQRPFEHPVYWSAFACYGSP